MITKKGTLKIMGIDYEVICLSPEALVRLYFDENGEEGVAGLERIVGRGAQHFGGLCDGGKARLFVNSEMPIDKQEKVLLHEVLEAVDGETCIQLKHNQIEAISNAFFLSSLLSSNKNLKGWFGNRAKPKESSKDITTNNNKPTRNKRINK